MPSSNHSRKNRIVVDSIHGDICPTEREWQIIDTATFQRLRNIKQLGMGHFTYPNAVHTRFAHSLGALHVMQRVLDATKRRGYRVTRSQRDNLRIAALLHDIGHYPYSHLMEGVDQVRLIEEIADGVDYPKVVPSSRYPKHVELGALIVTHQRDVINAIGGRRRAKVVADVFGRTGTADPQLSKLINSSFDMDRLDYMLRDANATGVPYGQIDINYLLNSLEISPTGMVGVAEKALPAAEHFLFARYFMYVTVYYHKTTCGFEEAAKQLLRRIRDDDARAETYELPKGRDAVNDLVKSPRLESFTDAFLDRIFRKARTDDDPVISSLAETLCARRPPKLLKEVLFLGPEHTARHVGGYLKQNCKFQVRRLAEQHGIPLGQFMYCETKALSLEERGARLTAQKARELGSEQADELVKVFCGGADEPKSLVDIERSLVHKCADNVLKIYRLYVVYHGEDEDSKIEQLREAVSNWDQV